MGTQTPGSRAEFPQVGPERIEGRVSKKSTSGEFSEPCAILPPGSHGPLNPQSLPSREGMNIEQFMQGYKAAWEARSPEQFAALFHSTGEYHNTPFQVQRGTEQLIEYWKRVQLQEDVRVDFEILAATALGGLAHWHVTYKVASEELFQIWARSSGTGLPNRKPGDPLPRMVLDGVLQADFSGTLCSKARIWWHSMAAQG